MIFDIGGLTSDKQKKIAEGALKYIAIKEAFAMSKENNLPLYKNVLFRKYFTDFYKLDSGSWKSATSQEIFYRLFEGIRVNFNDVGYNLAGISNKNQALLTSAYSYIYNLLSYMSGYNEKSFSSKILHTLCNESPIIDSNILGGFGMSAQEEKGTISSIKATAVYEKLFSFYYSTSRTEITKTKKDKSKIIVYKEDEGFIGHIQNKIGNFEGGIKAMCANIYSNSSKLQTAFSKDFKALGINNATSELNKISLVKIIDFYLWAKFSKYGDKEND